MSIIVNIEDKKAIPFLRWAGGKKWLIKEMNGILRNISFVDYHEPFLGGGAIYFHLCPSNKAYLNDLNTQLIDTYQCIKENVQGVIRELKKFENTEQCYYQVRAEKYRSEVKMAARFIFLNQTSFNGIYRVNLNGEYNVPYGYREKDFFEPENLKRVAKILEKAYLSSDDFTTCIKNIKKNDLVFLDPPYTITHNDNGFFKYNQKLFSEKDQYKLAEMINQIIQLGAYYILTNAAHKKVKAIFNNGDRLMEFNRASLVGGKNASRNSYKEIVLTNIN